MAWHKVYVFPEGNPVCDFCSEDPVYKAYPAYDFIVEKEKDWVRESKGGWAACEECARLIDTDEWEVLYKRSIQKFAEHHGLTYHMAAVMLGKELRNMHALFRQHRLRES